ncbi:MAG: flotillin family protein, partial [Acutalibacteraceae bacterium]
VQLMIADKLEELVKIQVEAVKNLNIDKITVWDSMGGNGESSTTANFLSGIMKSVPPLNETLKMAGIKMPEFLGTEIKPETEPADEAAEIKEEKE